MMVAAAQHSALQAGEANRLRMASEVQRTTLVVVPTVLLGGAQRGQHSIEAGIGLSGLLRIEIGVALDGYVAVSVERNLMSVNSDGSAVAAAFAVAAVSAGVLAVLLRVVPDMPGACNRGCQTPPAAVAAVAAVEVATGCTFAAAEAVVQ
jgi:hypothetical protein